MTRETAIRISQRTRLIRVLTAQGWALEKAQRIIDYVIGRQAVNDLPVISNILELADDEYAVEYQIDGIGSIWARP